MINQLIDKLISCLQVSPQVVGSKDQAACAADVVINYALGFIPGYNGLKLVATLAGANFNFVQNGLSGKSIVTFDSGATITDPIQGVLLGD